MVLDFKTGITNLNERGVVKQRNFLFVRNIKFYVYHSEIFFVKSLAFHENPVIV